MDDAPACRPHPQTAVAIADHFQVAEALPRSWEAMQRLRFPLGQAHDRTRCGDQDGVILAVGHTLHSSVQQAWHRIEFRRSGSPSPHPGFQPNPEISLAVLMQPEDAVGNAAHFRMAPDAAIPNFAEFSIWRPTRP